MALIKRNNNQQVTIQKKANVSRDLDASKYKSYQRKTLKVDPPVYELVKTISYVTDVKMYNLVREMANIYLEKNVDVRDRENIIRMINQKGE